ncbi:hypothetical protein [Photobacterium damselae]|uniref:hypothetical protein n=1 Tax=Photobacterium damselae TaxID=38293 RepID=UPI004069599D
MKTFTVFRPTHIDQSTAAFLSDIENARSFKMGYSKLRWYKHNLSKSNVEEAFHTMISGVQSGILHPAIKVQAETPEEAFKLTNIYVSQYNNRIDYNWHHNEQVEIIPNIKGQTDECSMLSISSLEVGDLLHDGNKYYIITPRNFLTF